MSSINLFGITISAKKKKMGRPKGVKNKRGSIYLAERNKKILDEWNNTGATLDSLGKKYGGISRERIRQILKQERSKGEFVLESCGKHKNHLKLKDRYGDFPHIVEQEVLNRYQDPYYAEWVDSKRTYEQSLIHKAEKKLMLSGKIIPKISPSRRKDNTHRYQTIQSMKAKGHTLDQIGKKLGLGKVRICQLVKEMRELGYELERTAHPNQVKACSLTKEELQRRSELIMEAMRTKTPMRKIITKMGIPFANIYRHKSTYITENVYRDWLKKQTL